MSSDSVPTTALKLFRMLNGPGEGGSEFEFNCRSNQKEWLRLARYCMDLEAEGERSGRIAGLREAAAICSRLGLSTDARVALNDEANRLEKEQHKSISSDTLETKTKQER